MASFTGQQKEEMDISAILSTVAYYNEVTCEGSVQVGSDLNTIMKNLPESAKAGGDYQTIMAAIEANPSLGHMELISRSEPAYDSKLLHACAFRDPYSNNVYVAYRGTGDGKWVDNGEGLTANMTVMQETAVSYFDSVVESLPPEQLSEGRLIVTGHSKGGNEAQLVAMMSEHRDQVDNCYSYDGQGFSRKAIADMKESLGKEGYEESLRSMYSVNGENDYVHDLGLVIIPEENTYFIPTPHAGGFGEFHSIRYMIKGAGLNWVTDENGQILKGEQGTAGILAKNASKRLMALNEEQINDCAISVMFFLEFILAYDGVTGGEYKIGTGNRKIMTPEEFLGLCDVLLPDVGFDGARPGRSPAKPGLLVLVLADTGIDLLSLKVEEFYNTLAAWVSGKCRDMAGWYNQNFNVGYKYAAANTFVRVDTAKLKNYADRLERVNRRLSDLDRRLDSLYWRVGWLDLWNLMQADALTGYSWKIRKCKNYLAETAEDFELAERYIVSRASEVR